MRIALLAAVALLAFAPRAASGPVRVETLATGLVIPWEIAFGPDYRGDADVRPEIVASGLRTVVEGPRGKLYLLTSNRDGRGAPIAADDRIIRVVPPRD